MFSDLLWFYINKIGAFYRDFNHGSLIISTAIKDIQIFVSLFGIAQFWVKWHFVLEIARDWSVLRTDKKEKLIYFIIVYYFKYK